MAPGLYIASETASTSATTSTSGTVVFQKTSANGLVFDSAAGLGSEVGLAEEITYLGWRDVGEDSFQVRTNLANTTDAPGTTAFRFGPSPTSLSSSVDLFSTDIDGNWYLQGALVSRDRVRAGVPYHVVLIAQRNVFHAETASWVQINFGGAAGQNAWTPELALELDGGEIYFRISDWTGGQGVKPATGYFGDGTLGLKASALNLKGDKGDKGDPGANARPVTDTSFRREVTLASQLVYTTDTDGSWGAWQDIASITVAANEAGLRLFKGEVHGVVQEDSGGGGERVVSEVQITRTRASNTTTRVLHDIYGPRNLNPGAPHSDFIQASQTYSDSLIYIEDAQENDVYTLQVRHSRQNTESDNPTTLHYDVAPENALSIIGFTGTVTVTTQGSSITLASEAEAEAGTDNTKAVSPLTLAQVLADRKATKAEADAGTPANKIIYADILNEVISEIPTSGGGSTGSSVSPVYLIRNSNQTLTATQADRTTIDKTWNGDSIDIPEVVAQGFDDGYESMTLSFRVVDNNTDFANTSLPTIAHFLDADGNKVGSDITLMISGTGDFLVEILEETLQSYGSAPRGFQIIQSDMTAILSGNVPQSITLALRSVIFRLKAVRDIQHNPQGEAVITNDDGTTSNQDITAKHVVANSISTSALQAAAVTNAKINSVDHSKVTGLTDEIQRVSPTRAIATDSQIDAGTNDTTIVSPKGLQRKVSSVHTEIQDNSIEAKKAQANLSIQKEHWQRRLGYPDYFSVAGLTLDETFFTGSVAKTTANNTTFSNIGAFPASEISERFSDRSFGIVEATLSSVVSPGGATFTYRPIFFGFDEFLALTELAPDNEGAGVTNVLTEANGDDDLPGEIRRNVYTTTGAWAGIVAIGKLSGNQMGLAMQERLLATGESVTTTFTLTCRDRLTDKIPLTNIFGEIHGILPAANLYKIGQIIPVRRENNVQLFLASGTGDVGSTASSWVPIIGPRELPSTGAVDGIPEVIFNGKLSRRIPANKFAPLVDANSEAEIKIDRESSYIFAAYSGRLGTPRSIDRQQGIHFGLVSGEAFYRLPSVISYDTSFDKDGGDQNGFQVDLSGKAIVHIGRSGDTLVAGHDHTYDNIRLLLMKFPNPEDAPISELVTDFTAIQTTSNGFLYDAPSEGSTVGHVQWGDSARAFVLSDSSSGIPRPVITSPIIRSKIVQQLHTAADGTRAVFDGSRPNAIQIKNSEKAAQDFGIGRGTGVNNGQVKISLQSNVNAWKEGAGGYGRILRMPANPTQFSPQAGVGNTISFPINIWAYAFPHNFVEDGLYWFEGRRRGALRQGQDPISANRSVFVSFPVPGRLLLQTRRAANNSIIDTTGDNMTSINVGEWPSLGTIYMGYRDSAQNILIGCSSNGGGTVTDVIEVALVGYEP